MNSPDEHALKNEIDEIASRIDDIVQRIESLSSDNTADSQEVTKKRDG